MITVIPFFDQRYPVYRLCRRPAALCNFSLTSGTISKKETGMKRSLRDDTSATREPLNFPRRFKEKNCKSRVDQRPRVREDRSIKAADSRDRMERVRRRVKGRNAKHARFRSVALLSLSSLRALTRSAAVLTSGLLQARAQLSQQFGRDEYEFYFRNGNAMRDPR